MSNKANVELIIFDMAGTTVYDGDAVHNCLSNAIRELGLEVTRDEVNRVMGIAKPIAIRDLLTSRVPLEQMDNAVEGGYALFLDFMLSHYRTSPEVREVEGAAEVFRQLHARGVKVALDTGFSRPIADAVLERLGWLRDGLVDFTVTTDEVAAGRPAPDMALRAMELAGVLDPSRVAKVGDTPVDLLEGTAAKCGWVIGVTEGSHTADELSGYPHTNLVSSVRDIPAVVL